jgi:hypothetical protein
LPGRQRLLWRWGVGRLAHEEAKVDQREHNVANVGAPAYAPVLEDESSHDAEPLEGQVPASQGELAAVDVPPFLHPLLAELEGGEHEEIGVLVEPLFAEANPVHDPVAKCQFCHCSPLACRSCR